MLAKGMVLFEIRGSWSLDPNCLASAYGRGGHMENGCLPLSCTLLGCFAQNGMSPIQGFDLVLACPVALQ
jgi:hypothetical protein